MARLNFRTFLAGCLILAATLPAGLAEGWESTVSAFTPGSFPEIKPMRAQYAFGWNGLTAATADFHLTKSVEGRLNLEVTGATTGLARALWKFDGKHSSSTDARTLRPIQVREIESARAKTWDTEANYRPEGVTSRREERRGSSVKTKTRHFDFPNVMSLSSSLLYLRSQPLADGTSARVMVYPATSAYLCTVTVLGRERISVATGTYEAIKLGVQLGKIGKKRELSPHKKFKRATVWLSNDANRLVLRIEAQIFIGTVFAELQSVQFENAKP